MSARPITTEEPSREPEDKPKGGKYMTIMEHLQELRYRLIVSALSVVATTGASIYFAGRMLDFLKKPAEDRSEAFFPIFTEPMEGLVAHFRIALMAGITFAMPMLIYQTLMFVTPALTRKEKRWVYSIVFAATLAFAGGVAFAFYIALPPALGFLLTYPEDVAEPHIKIGSYVDFVTRLLPASAFLALRHRRGLRPGGHRHPQHRPRHPVVRGRPDHRPLRSGRWPGPPGGAATRVTERI